MAAPGGSDLLVGIDVGTQSAKVDVLDLEGRVVAAGRQALRPLDTPSPGVAEHPGDDLWEALTAACRDALGAVAAGRVRAVGLCGIRFTRALLREDGSLAAPVISWMDERASRPHASAEAPADVHWVTASSGYLTARLVGRVRDSVAAYQGPWPVDMAAWDWLPEGDGFESWGVRRDELASLVLPGEVLGAVTASAASATGLPEGVPVVATANDKAVEALGAGLREDSDLLVSLGTYVCAMTPGDRLRPASPTVWTNFGAEPGRFLHESEGVRRGMWTVTWLRDLVGPGLGATTEERVSALERAAASLAPGADGLLCVPDWLAPVDQPWRRGAFVGLDARHGPGHLHRAVLEGLAMTVGQHATAMSDELGRSPGRLLLTGGGAASPTMRQIAADVLDLPALVSSVGSPAARGAAICAGVGAGLFSSYDEAVTAMVRHDVVVTPTVEGVAAYAELTPALADLRAALVQTLRRGQRGIGRTARHE